MVFEQDGDTVAANRFFRKGAGTFRNQVPVFQPDGLFIEPRVSNDRRRNLRVVGFYDANPILGQVLMADLEGGNLDHRFDHLGVQKTEPVGATGNFVSHGCHGV